MDVYPMIELMGGKCVSFLPGQMETPHVWHVDPVEKAREFAAAGAAWLDVTDLDAVTGQDETNAALVEEIIRQAGIPVQVAGGIGSDERVRHWHEVGAGRMVLGKAAVRAPDWVKALAKYYPDQIVVALDIWQGKVVVGDWNETSAFDPVEFVHFYDGVPLAGIMVTDYDRDVDQPESSFALTIRIAEETRTPVFSSGLVKSLDDISTLKYVPNVAAVIVGRALMSRDIDLSEAIALAQPDPEERTAQFR